MRASLLRQWGGNHTSFVLLQKANFQHKTGSEDWLIEAKSALVPKRPEESTELSFAALRLR